MGSATQDQHRGMSMSKPARGTKRVCPSCGERFYDLNRTPIVCPVCESTYQVTPPPRPRAAGNALSLPRQGSSKSWRPTRLCLKDQRSSVLKRPKKEQARFRSRMTRRSSVSAMTGPRFPQLMTRTPSWKKRRKARPTCQGSSAAARTRKEASRPLPVRLAVRPRRRRISERARLCRGERSTAGT